MLITTVITYTTSYFSYYTNNPNKQKSFFYLGLFLDLLIFILFKYIHVIDINSMNWPNWSAQNLLIPIGISFYTFKTIGYCIDVYKKKYPPENSFIYYALSVSFFPQLIAGPIEKSVTISSQLKRNYKFKLKNCIEGGKLILWGLFKKIVIADSIAQIINPIFNDIYSYSGLDYVIAFIAFSYLVYADFSGYSDIAIGSAKCFGINLPANFNKPFFSKNYRDFWTRWHITLSKWLKEYVFNLLGRQNKLKLIVNLFVVFLIVGLWHGATVNFIIYAQVAFAFLLLDIASKNMRYKFFRFLGLQNKNISMKIINYFAIIFMCIVIGVFYGIPNFKDAIYVLTQLFNPGMTLNLKLNNTLLLLAYILFFEILQYFQSTANGHCFQKINNFYLRLFLYLILLFSIILLSSRPNMTFQYFQF